MPPRRIADDGDDAPKPLSNKQLIIIVSVLTTDAMNMSMMFSYVGLLVAHIGDGLSKSSAGYASGFLLGIFQGSQVLVLKHWGHLSDRVGRRPVLLTGMFFSVVCAVCFGLSTNLYMAIAIRFVHGLFTVGGATMKTVITEMTDVNSAAKGFSWMSMARAVGSMIGPSVGGFLYDPNRSEFVKLVMGDGYHSALFETYPALLPSLFLGAYGSVVWVVAYFNLPESNKHAQPLGLVLGEIATSVRRKLCCEGRPTTATDSDTGSSNDDDVNIEEGQHKSTAGSSDPISSRKNEDDIDSRHLKRVEDNDEDTSEDIYVTIDLMATQIDVCAVEAAIGELERYRLDNNIDDHLQEVHARALQAPTSSPDSSILEEKAAVIQDANNALNLKSKVSYTDIIHHPALKYVMPVYMIISSYNVCSKEVFPLYAIAYRIDGGLEFTSSLVGICFMINAFVAFFANMQFSRIVARVPLLTLFRVLVVCAGISLFLLSFLTYLNNTTWELIMFVPLSAVRSTCSTWAFSICMMLVANVSPKKHLGAFMSMSHACGAIARCVSPIVASPLFAWSITGSHIFPFNHHLVFLVLLLECLLSFYLSTKVSESQVGRRFK